MYKYLDYIDILSRSMEYLVREILTRVQKHGFYDDHHLYISFSTKHKGVVLSQRTRKIYEEEITIVLQHQYDNLIVSDDKFKVSLSFNGIKESIEVPFDAINSLTDPSVNFSIKLKSNQDLDNTHNSSYISLLDSNLRAILTQDDKKTTPTKKTTKTQSKVEQKVKKKAKIISIDKYINKKNKK